MTAITIISLIIATIIPLIALYIIYTRDLYSTGAFKFVILCFLWGGVAYYLAAFINGELYYTYNVDWNLVVRAIAPVEEEIFKGLILLYLVRRKEFTYFVDGAIYGFAIGIGFAVLENYQYLGEAAEGAKLSIALIRVISTNMMHATGSAIIGIALGYARFSKRSGMLFYILGGAAISMAIHATFNNIASAETVNGTLLLIFIIVIGVLGFGMIIFFIRRGTNEAQNWIRESLGQVQGVTDREVQAVDKIRDLDVVLGPLVPMFGQEKVELIEKMLFKQAKLGILRKNLDKLQDEGLLKSTAAEIENIRAEMDVIRNEIGSYAMVTLRGIFPDDVNLLGDFLNARITESGGPKAGGLQDLLGQRIKPSSSTDN